MLEHPWYVKNPEVNVSFIAEAQFHLEKIS